MKEDLTRRTMKCAGCGDYFVPLDDSNYCETCTPQDYENHPFQPQRIDDMTDCVDE
jgi:uncharacterized OB-fold protein